MIGTILAHLFLSKHNSYLKIYSVYVTIELHYQKRNIAVRSHLVKWTIINSKTNCSVATFPQYVQQLLRNGCYICEEKDKY